MLDPELPLRCGTGRLEVPVGDLAGVPHQRTLWMRDQIARRKHFRGRKLSGLESEGSLTGSGDLPAVENIQPDLFRSLSAALLLCRRKRYESQHANGHDNQN